MTTPLMLAKVGGSLFTLPDLSVRLRSWRASVAGPVCFIPGGGLLADAVRQLQPIHTLDEPTAHWTAIRTMTVNAHWLSALTHWPVCTEMGDAPTAWLDVWPWCQTDSTLGHTWDTTSDSIAARIAVAWNQPLTLLKSTANHARSWTEAATLGLVDNAFPNVVGAHPVHWVNLRAAEWR